MADTRVSVDDCWNRVGTWSEERSSCPRLSEVRHCLNCDVYAAAGRALLNRAPPPNYLEDWKTVLAQPAVHSSGALQSLVIFRLEREWLALPTALFNNIVEPRAVHTLPHNRNTALLGLVTVRGELVVCISLSHIVSDNPGDSIRNVGGAFPRDVVIERDDWRWAFPVSEVHGVVRFSRDQIGNSDRYTGPLRKVFIAGLVPWRNTQVVCLDDEVLMQTLSEVRMS